jgi:uncharacterized membrane protein
MKPATPDQLRQATRAADLITEALGRISGEGIEAACVLSAMVERTAAVAATLVSGGTARVRRASIDIAIAITDVVQSKVESANREHLGRN